MAWARVMETRITKVGNTVVKGVSITVAGKLFKVAYDSDWGSSRANVSLTLRRSDTYGLDKVVAIEGFFSIDGLEILSIDGPNEDEVNFLRSHADEASVDIARDLRSRSATSRTFTVVKSTNSLPLDFIVIGNSASEDWRKSFIVGEMA